VNTDYDDVLRQALHAAAESIEPAGDGNFVILVDYRDHLGDLTRIKLLKISPDGVLLDSAVDIGTPANDFSRSVTLLGDGGFILTGTTEFTSTFSTINNPDPDLGDFFNYRLDRNLDVVPINEWGPISPGFGGKLDVAVIGLAVLGVVDMAAPFTLLARLERQQHRHAQRRT